jgi:serine/threonine protein kinase, bacterial
MAAPPSPIPSTTATTTAPEVSRAGFFGEWGQYSVSVTLAPDGSAHYAVTSGYDAASGAFNSTSWSATWSPMTSTTAMIVLTKQLESTGDTNTQGLNRYSGEAFTFTLRSDGYATITSPSSGEQFTLCPRGTGFQDNQMLCGA